jgi:hypothetical protein
MVLPSLPLQLRRLRAAQSTSCACMQLECQLLGALNCAPGAATKVWGCSACPAGFGASSVAPPYFCDVACPSACANCDNIAWPLTASDDGLCNACMTVRILPQRAACKDCRSPVLQLRLLMPVLLAQAPS